MARRQTQRMAGAMANAKIPQGRTYQEQGYINLPKGSRLLGLERAVLGAKRQNGTSASQPWPTAV